MNKYQEALNNLKEIEKNYTFSKIGTHFHVNCDTLQELVEKETPKKPIEIEEKDIVVGKIIIYNCPSCNHGLFVKFIEINRVAKYKSNYCEVCGQALDWSEEDE